MLIPNNGFRWLTVLMEANFTSTLDYYYDFFGVVGYVEELSEKNLGRIILFNSQKHGL